MKDVLGDRMKRQYEDRTRFFLPRRTYTIIRLDGKAFHTLTRGMEKPFDPNFVRCMDKTALALCRKIQGAQLGFVQSDEISILMTDFDKHETEAWFDGNLQKIVSVSAGWASAHFTDNLVEQLFANIEWIADAPPSIPCFDARAFTIPDPVEVGNYFVWRQKDAMRNAISMVGQKYFSAKELHGKSGQFIIDMLGDGGIELHEYPEGCTRGRWVWQDDFVKEVEGGPNHGTVVNTTEWRCTAAPVFTDRLATLYEHIPLLKIWET